MHSILSAQYPFDHKSCPKTEMNMEQHNVVLYELISAYSKKNLVILHVSAQNLKLHKTSQHIKTLRDV